MLIALIFLLYSWTSIATDVCVCRHVWMQIHLFMVAVTHFPCRDYAIVLIGI